MKKHCWSRGTSAAAGALGLLLILGGCGTEKEKEPKVEVTEKVAENDRNADLLRRAYESIGKGDVPGALALYDDSIVFHIPGINQLAGDHTGKQAVGTAMRKFRELSGGTFKLQPAQIVANDDYGFVLAEVSASRNGKTIEENPVQVWRFVDGEPVEIWLYPINQQAFNEFWS